MPFLRFPSVISDRFFVSMSLRFFHSGNRPVAIRIIVRVGGRKRRIVWIEGLAESKMKRKDKRKNKVYSRSPASSPLNRISILLQIRLIIVGGIAGRGIAGRRITGRRITGRRINWLLVIRLHGANDTPLKVSICFPVAVYGVFALSEHCPTEMGGKNPSAERTGDQ